MSRDLAIRALLAIRSRSDVAPEEYAALRTVMRQYLTTARPGISDADLSDAVDEAIMRLISRPESLAALDATTVLGYVLRSARNAQIDRWRATRMEVPADHADPALTDSARDDLAVLALLERTASLSTVRSLLTALDDAGDDTTIRVVITWLDLASATGTDPTAREVAAQLNLSHSTVVRALQRARAHLAREDSESGAE